MRSRWGCWVDVGVGVRVEERGVMDFMKLVYYDTLGGLGWLVFALVFY